MRRGDNYIKKGKVTQSHLTMGGGGGLVVEEEHIEQISSFFFFLNMERFTNLRVILAQRPC